MLIKFEGFIENLQQFDVLLGHHNAVTNNGIVENTEACLRDVGSDPFNLILEFRGQDIDYHASLVFFRGLDLLPGKCSRRDAKRTSPGGPPVRACPRMLSVLVPESRNRHTVPGIVNHNNQIRDTLRGFYNGKVFLVGFHEEKKTLGELEGIQAPDNGLYQTIEQQNISKK